MNSNLKNRAFLRNSAARVATAGAVATGVTFGLATHGDKDDSDMTSVQTTTMTSTEELDDDRDDVGDDDRMNN